MSASSFAAAQSLFDYSLLLPCPSSTEVEEEQQLHQHQDTHHKATTEAGRLYFVSCQNHVAQQQDPTSVVGCLRDGIAQSEQRECGLHRVRLAPSFTILTAVSAGDPDTILYAERVDAASSVAEEAILTSCPHVFPAALQADESYNIATAASLCVYQDTCGSTRGDASAADFWQFLKGVLLHGLSEGTSAAAVAAVRSSFLPLYEPANDGDSEQKAERVSKTFCHDAFAESEEGGSTRNIMAVDTTAAVHAAIARLQDVLAHCEQRHGGCALVLELTWRRLKQLRQRSSPLLSPLQGQTEKKACVVWLRDTPTLSTDSAEVNSGVYADAALEMLLDELVLAAATAQTAQDLTQVLEEPGVQHFFTSCTLTKELKSLLQSQFVELSKGHRPLFHWLVCAPSSTSLTLKNKVTRRDFGISAGGGCDDFWSAMEELEHWKEVAGVVDSVRSAAMPLVPAYASSPADNPASAEAVDADLSSSLSLSTSLREKARVSRQRRAIRQSGHQPHSSSHDGSVLSRQRRKLNVPKLYGFEDGENLAASRSATSLETSLAGSGVFHHPRSSPNTSISGTSLLEAEETLGRSTRRTARLVKRIPKATAKADASA